MNKKKMNVFQLTIITMVNMIGCGIIMLPAKLAQVGTMSIISWIITTIGAIALAFCFAKCAINNKKEGGMGAYAEYTFGRSGNFLTNYTYTISCIIANGAIALSAVGYGATLFGIKLDAISSAICAIIIIWITTIANFGGARITGRIGSFTIWGITLPVLIVSFYGWKFFSTSQYMLSWNPNHLGFFDGISKSISITLWCFLGLESAAANQDAVENPEKNVPIACLGGTILAGIIYIVSTGVIAGIIPNNELLNSDAPFGYVFATIFNPVIGKIVMATMVIGCFGSLLAWQFTIGQVLKSLALDGYFPQIFKFELPNGTPIKALIISGIIQSVLVLMTMSEVLMKQFSILVNLSVVTTLVPYLLSMASLKNMQYISGAKNAKFSNKIAFIAGIYSLYAMYTAGLEAMFYGGLVTFAGWTFYGVIANKFNN